MTGLSVCTLLAVSLLPSLVLASAPTPSPLAEARPGDVVARLWQEGTRLEEQGDLAASAQVYERIVRLRPADASTYWRIARNYWNVAIALPESEEQEYDAYVRLTEQWADRGLEADAQCGECYLYKVAGLGGRLRKQSRLAAARKAKEIATLLERGIEILRARPTHATDPELEELYYGAAQFYRTMPEWGLLDLVLGVRGNRRRALEYMREANAIATVIDGERPAYMLELSAALLCVGHEENDPTLVKEGNDLLARLVGAPEIRAKDARSVADAEKLASKPEDACGYQR